MPNDETDKKLISRDSAEKAVEVAGNEPSTLTKEGVNEMMEQLKSEFRKETERQVLLERASLITIFGLFASITSFLIVEFQCLKAMSGPWQIVGFSCVVFALLLGFNIGLDYLVKSRFDKDSELHGGYIAFVFLFFAIGCCAIHFGEKQELGYQKKSDHRIHEHVEQPGAIFNKTTQEIN